VSRIAYIGPAILVLYAALRSIDVVAQAYLMDPHYYWLGARILAQGADPYDATTWDAAVRASFAQFGAAMPPPWPASFRYPLWTAVAFFPLAALPLRAATAVWQALLITATVAGAVLTLRAAGAPSRTRPLFLTLVLASQPFIFTVIVGQFGGVMLLAAGAYAVAATSARQITSGLALAALALKPHVTVALVPAMLADLIARRRWPAVGAAAGVGALLVGVSLALRPTWPLEWLSELAIAGAAQPNGANLTGVFTTFGIDRVWALAAIPLVLAAAAGLLAMSPRASIDLVAVAACVSALITPYSGSHDQMLLAPAWARTLAIGLRSPPLSAAVLLGGLVLAASLLPWALYAFALRSRPDEALNGFVPLAGFALLGLAYAMDARQRRT
jgi:glycosyl transferase family 87